VVGCNPNGLGALEERRPSKREDSRRRHDYTHTVAAQTVVRGGVARHQGDDEGLCPHDEETGVNPTLENCFDFEVEIVREIHAEAITRFGGSDDVRETALLASAVAAPQASFGGQSPYQDIAEMAAAYLFYQCENHPFVHGNKRATAGACLVFLRLNGVEWSAGGLDWEELTRAGAACAIDRDEDTQRLRKLSQKSA